MLKLKYGIGIRINYSTQIIWLHMAQIEVSFQSLFVIVNFIYRFSIY